MEEIEGTTTKRLECQMRTRLEDDGCARRWRIIQGIRTSTDSSVVGKEYIEERLSRSQFFRLASFLLPRPRVTCIPCNTQPMAEPLIVNSGVETGRGVA